MIIEKEKYKALIREEIQDLLTAKNDVLLEQTESIAWDTIGEYLANYDCETAIKKSEHLKMILIDLSLFHLYSQATPNRMPEHRLYRYEQAMEWLKGVSKGSIKTKLSLKTENNQATTDWRINGKKRTDNDF